jgi:hypothetical protein
MTDSALAGAMSPPRLCVDIDNVIAQTDTVMRRTICLYTQGRVNLGCEYIQEFDYDKCTDSNGGRIGPQEWRAIHELFSEHDAILSIEPMPGAIEQLRRLEKHYQVHLATTRLARARRPTIEWLERHGFPPYDLHFLRHGRKHASLARFAAAVEDHYERAVSFAEAETTCYLIRHPWNQSKPKREGIEWVEGWAELGDRLVDRATGG